MDEVKFCTLCKNRCPLDNPRCPDVVTKEYIAKVKADAAKSDHCTICEKHCLYTALACDLGRTMAEIRKKI